MRKGAWSPGFASVDRRGKGRKCGGAGRRRVPWPEPGFIIASIVVVNVAALCRKWPVNITIAVPSSKPSPSLPL